MAEDERTQDPEAPAEAEDEPAEQQEPTEDEPAEQEEPTDDAPSVVGTAAKGAAAGAALGAVAGAAKHYVSSQGDDDSEGEDQEDKE